MSQILAIALILSALFTILSFFTVKVAFFLANPTKKKAIIFWLLTTLLFWVAINVFYKEEMSVMSQGKQGSVTQEVLPTYTITVVDEIANMKLSLDIDIEKPVDEATLTKLAETIYKDKKGKNYQNVFMMWYLPGMPKGSGAWATTNYNPNLVVRVIGE